MIEIVRVFRQGLPYPVETLRRGFRFCLRVCAGKQFGDQLVDLLLHAIGDGNCPLWHQRFIR
jgi:hypothetical protein